MAIKIKRGITVFLFMACIIASPTWAATGASSNDANTPEGFSSALMTLISKTYYHPKNKPMIKVAIFDVKDNKGSISVGSRYLANQFRLAFGSHPQFELSPLGDIEEKMSVRPYTFIRRPELKDYLLNTIKADVYILGEIQSQQQKLVICRFMLFNAAGEPIVSNDPLTLFWKANMTASGFSFFKQALMQEGLREGSQDQIVKMADVVFLSQPISDDPNPWWEVNEGLFFRRDGARKFSLTSETKEKVNRSAGLTYGSVLQGRIKSYEESAGTGFVVKNFGLVVYVEGREALPLESYVIPRESPYYYMTNERGRSPMNRYLRFQYQWHYPEMGVIPSGISVQGWEFFMAEQKWAVKMPVGTHSLLAFLAPSSQKLFGAVTQRAEYNKKVPIVVDEGTNYYTINFAHHADEPKIFVKRLKIDERAGRGLSIGAYQTVHGSD